MTTMKMMTTTVTAAEAVGGAGTGNGAGNFNASQTDQRFDDGRAGNGNVNLVVKKEVDQTVIGNSYQNVRDDMALAGSAGTTTSEVNVSESVSGGTRTLDDVPQTGDDSIRAVVKRFSTQPAGVVWEMIFAVAAAEFLFITWAFKYLLQFELVDRRRSYRLLKQIRYRWKWRALPSMLAAVCVLSLLFVPSAGENSMRSRAAEYHDSKKVSIERAAEEAIAESVAAEANENAVSSDYAPDQIGRIAIPGTRIDYALMQGEEYLTKDIERNASCAGVPFVPQELDAADSDNIIIYGHNMKDGSMFASLLNYKEDYYLQKNPTVELELNGEITPYRIFAVLPDKVRYSDEDGFKFYDFVNADSEAEYDAAIHYFKEHSLYETGIQPSFGDDLVTLVTCDRSHNGKQGRFVVVAAREIN